MSRVQNGHRRVLSCGLETLSQYSWWRVVVADEYPLHEGIAEDDSRNGGDIMSGVMQAP